MTTEPERAEGTVDVNWLVMERYEGLLAELYGRLEIEPSYRDAVAIETALAKAVTAGFYIGTAEVTHVIHERARELDTDFGIELFHHGAPVEDRWQQEFGGEDSAEI